MSREVTCEHCGGKSPAPPVPNCNLCGESCGCAHDWDEMGLINCTVSGGYESTAGNGCGALDDCSSYKFSMCEFCLDWLFSQFRIPPVVSAMGGEPEPFRPAEQRVRDDEWRPRKDEFLMESQRRAALRAKRT